MSGTVGVLSVWIVCYRHCRYYANIMLTVSMGLWLLIIFTHIHLSSHVKVWMHNIKITVIFNFENCATYCSVYVCWWREHLLWVWECCYNLALTAERCKQSDTIFRLRGRSWGGVKSFGSLECLIIWDRFGSFPYIPTVETVLFMGRTHVTGI